MQMAGEMYLGAGALAYDDLTRADTGEIEEILDALSLCPSGRVVDAACGSGRLTMPLAERSARQVTAIDVSKELLALLRERLAREPFAESVEVVCGSILDLPMPDASVTAYVLGTSTVNLFDTGDRARLLAEAHRVLTPNGQLLISILDRHEHDTSVVGRGYSGGEYRIENVLQPDDTVVSRVTSLAERATDNGAEATVYESKLYSVAADQLHAEISQAGFEITDKFTINQQPLHLLIVARNPGEFRD